LGAHTVACGPERGVGGAHEGGNELAASSGPRWRANPRRAWRRVQVVRPLQSPVSSG
jgi:hypothetical protein